MLDFHGGTTLGHGDGGSKKSAEQKAAKQALALIQVKGEPMLKEAVENGGK